MRRLVRTLLDRQARPAGQAGVVWDGRSDAGSRVASGVHLCRLDVEGEIRTRQMTLME